MPLPLGTYLKGLENWSREKGHQPSYPKEYVRLMIMYTRQCAGRDVSLVNRKEE